MRLADHLGAESFLILLRDSTTGRCRPAPGFLQTLPGGPTWRAFLTRCAEPGEFESTVTSSEPDRTVLARALTSPDGTTFVLLGGEPRASLHELAAACSLLIEMLKAENAAIEALGQATAAQEATRRATELAKALDAARSEVSTKAAELRHLNATLEQLVAQEIEERMQVEEALRQSQKMEAIGQLTGGIAHDFNNLLTGIVGSLDLMQTRIRQGRLAELDRYAGAAMTSAQRAAALTHRLLAFSRRQPLDPKPLAANRLVAEMEDLLRRTLGPAISLEMVLAGGLWPTLCDPVQLESALLNLCINARDAMPDGGRLTVETSNAHLDDAYAATQQDVSPGQYVAISVTDTGMGMSPGLVSRVFEPFFTTKPIGQGTGLGLSMVYGFAKQSEGHIRIYSEVGKGTTVTLYLPRHRGEVDETHDDAHVAEMPRAEAGETVLVVEDEPVVRGLITEVLGEMGFRTVEAQDGPSGLRLLQSRRRIDLLITDVGLPGINGRQLADQARQKRPDLKVLFITGYAENATLANGFLEPGMAMLTKPFAVDALMLKIHQLASEKADQAVAAAIHTEPRL